MVALEWRVELGGITFSLRKECKVMRNELMKEILAYALELIPQNRSCYPSTISFRS